VPVELRCLQPCGGGRQVNWRPYRDPWKIAHSNVRGGNDLGSGHYDGHLTVVFARRPYGYFNVLAESGEEVNKAAY